MLNNTDNAKVFGSRERIRNELIEHAKSYLELGNLDFSKASFLSYIIDIMSIVSANNIFYSSMVYKDFFFLTSQLPESVNNLSKWIGYTIPPASPALVNVLFTIPLQFADPDVNIIFPEDFRVYSGNTPYSVSTQFDFNAALSPSTLNQYGQTLLTILDEMSESNVSARILNNKIVTLRNSNGLFFPVRIDSSTPTPTASFLLPFKQENTILNTFQIPDELETYQFYNKTITGFEGQVSDIEVYVIPTSASSESSLNQSEIDILVDNIKNSQSVPDFKNAFKINDTTTIDRSGYIWNKSDSGIFTLSPNDEKYVYNAKFGGVDLTFGNDVLGKQPPKNSLIAVLISTTLGEEGRAISGSITKSDPIYYQEIGGTVKKVKTTIINPSPSTGGENAPSISKIKTEAIANLTSGGNLVSDIDYDNFNTIADNVPLKGSLAILKRSDLKTSEISLFSRLTYSNPGGDTNSEEIVPTRNATITTPDDELYLVKGLAGDGINSEFETLFNMKIDPYTTDVSYEYIVSDIDIPTTLESTDSAYMKKFYMFAPTVNLKSDIDPEVTDSFTLTIDINTNNILSDQFKQAIKEISESAPGLVNYTAIESYSANLYIPGQSDSVVMSVVKNVDNETTNFTYSMTVDETFPVDQVKFKFDIKVSIPDEIKDVWGITSEGNDFRISTYSYEVIVKKDMSEFMKSVVVLSNNSYIIYDVPTVESIYFTQSGFNKKDFELSVIQKLISNINISSKRMLTDSISIKFPDTSGKLTNLKHNPETYKIKSRTLDAIPGSPTNLDKYIVNGSESPTWAQHRNKIVTYNSNSGWRFDEGKINDIALITDESDGEYNKKFIQDYKGNWVDIELDIPFIVRLRIHRDLSVSISSGALVSNIKTALLDHFAPKFGMDKSIDRSEIIKVAREVTGVDYCELESPGIDIKFKYKIKDLSESELLLYTPQLVAFTEDSIIIDIV